MRRAAWILAAVALVAVLVIGLRQASDGGPPPQRAAPFDLDAELRKLEGAPAPLAALHADANQLLDGEGFEARLRELRGHPVVINKWGSWCGPCRAEFPVFQQVSTRLGKKVAFLGLNGLDPAAAAREFLDENPVPYPSYVDERGTLAEIVDASGPFPMTIFVDRRGEVVIPLARPYETAAELEADIEKYLRV